MINDSSDRTPGTSIREVRFEHRADALGIGTPARACPGQ